MKDPEYHHKTFGFYAEDDGKTSLTLYCEGNLFSMYYYMLSMYFINHFKYFIILIPSRI